MATSTDTQALLSELKAPSEIAPGQVRNAIGNFLQGGAKVQAQAAILQRLLQAAEITEPNAAVDALLPEGYQKFGALLREAANAERSLRAVGAVLKEIVEWDDRLREAAQPVGYTV